LARETSIKPPNAQYVVFYTLKANQKMRSFTPSFILMPLKVYGTPSQQLPSPPPLLPQEEEEGEEEETVL